MTATTTVVSMVNGMLASSTLMMPSVGLASGWLTSSWTCLAMGYMLYYTAALIITHLGKAINMKYSILAHFNNNYKYMSAYGFIIWLSFVPFTVGGFNMLCSEINGLVGYQSIWVTIGALALLIAATIASRMLHWAE